MFRADGLEGLAQRHGRTLHRLAEVETALNASLFRMDQAVRAIILAALSGESLLFVGPPGTAKSLLIRRFCSLIGLDTEKDAVTFDEKVDYFEYLLTPFTEPSELFGYFDLAKLQGEAPVLERLDDGHMQHARVVFLDEVFNASSAILNSILTFMNERRFHDRGRVLPVPLEMMFAASNMVPRKGELQALFDRFVLRCWVTYAEPTASNVTGLLKAGWETTYGQVTPPVMAPDLLEDLAALRADVDSLSGSLLDTGDTDAMATLAVQIARIRAEHWSGFSARRIMRLTRVMLMSMLYRLARDEKVAVRRGRVVPGPQDYALIPRYFLDVNPTEVRAEERLRKLVDDVPSGGRGAA